MRLTKWDDLSKCYTMKPEVRQGLNIQKLGQLEDRDDACRMEYKTVDGEYEYECGKCGAIVRNEDNFCSECGQRLRK